MNASIPANASGSQAPPLNPRGTRFSTVLWNYIPTAPAVENAISVRTNTVRARTHPDNHIRRSFIENLVPSSVNRGIEELNTLPYDNLRATIRAGDTGK